MTKCNYHALQDTYTMLEEQLSVMSEKIADLKLNLEVSELDIDLDNLEAQLLGIAEKIEGLDVKLNIDNIDIDLDNLESQLVSISEKMDELSLNVVIDSIDRNILLNVETCLSDINSQIDNFATDLIAEINIGNVKAELNEISTQLKIKNQISLLKELDIDAEIKQNQYEALKDLLFDVDDVINASLNDSNDDEPVNPIIDGGSG